MKYNRNERTDFMGARWRRRGGYILGIFIEVAAVGAISLAALVLMLLVKVIAT